MKLKDLEQKGFTQEELEGLEKLGLVMTTTLNDVSVYYFHPKLESNLNPPELSEDSISFQFEQLKN